MTVDSFKYLPRLIATFYQMTEREPEYPIPRTPLPGPIADCTFGLVTSGGLFHLGVEAPFDLEREKEEPGTIVHSAETWPIPLKEAIESFKAAIAKEPKIAIAHYHLGIALAREGKAKEAIEQFETFLNKVPKSAAAHYHLGINYYNKGDVEKAIANFKAAVEIDPSDERSKKNLEMIEELRSKFF